MRLSRVRLRKASFGSIPMCSTPCMASFSRQYNASAVMTPPEAPVNRISGSAACPSQISRTGPQYWCQFGHGSGSPIDFGVVVFKGRTDLETFVARSTVIHFDDRPDAFPDKIHQPDLLLRTE